MNNRLKELVGRALDQAVPQTWTTLSHDELMRFTGVFAELIIQECATIANEKEENFPEYDPGISVHWYIMKHFGIEK